MKHKHNYWYIHVKFVKLECRDTAICALKKEKEVTPNTINAQSR